MTDQIHYTIAINRFIDISLTFFNSLVALMLLTAPWYKIVAANGETFQGCHLAKGTVLAPFTSGLCTFESFEELPLGGDKWATMHSYCITYLTIALLVSSLIGYESVVHGLRKWNNTNTLSFVLNIVTIIIHAIILVESGNVPKPVHIANELATTLITSALVVSCIRVLVLGWLMYHTYTHDRVNGGFFGTGGKV